MHGRARDNRRDTEENQEKNSILQPHFCADSFLPVVRPEASKSSFCIKMTKKNKKKTKYED